MHLLKGIDKVVAHLGGCTRIKTLSCACREIVMKDDERRCY